MNTWYQNNLTSVTDKIDKNAGFCNDRTVTESGISTTYAAYGRLYNINPTPTFECSNSSDLFTTSGSNGGNKALQYPIGLITADEVAYSGEVWDGAQRNTYLYIGLDYWTMSPQSYDVMLGTANVFYAHVNALPVSPGGGISNPVNNTVGVRPVINLKASVQFSSGDGTVSNPYIVS